MLTITAVTISGGTRTLSSVTKVPPTVCRVLVSQFGVPSATGPMSRATSPRATPSTRARRTCAANGTRRRRASTECLPGTVREGTTELAGAQESAVIRPKSSARRRVRSHLSRTSEHKAVPAPSHPPCARSHPRGPSRTSRSVRGVGRTGAPARPRRDPGDVLERPPAGPAASLRVAGAGGPLSVGPDRAALLQERGHALDRAGELAGGGHSLAGVGVGVPLGPAELGVHRLLAPRLARPRPAGGPAHEVGDGGVEL